MRVFKSAVVAWGLVAAGTAALRTAASTAGIESFVQRRLPRHVGSFLFELVDPEPDSKSKGASELDVQGERLNDSYNVSSTDDGKILVQGNTVGGLFAGLHEYLSSQAHVDIWWFVGSQLDKAPRHLPVPSTPLTGSSIVPYRYYLNTVTTSYTSAFWGWEQWEEHLDWMALRGINIALAWIGFEKIYIEVFRDMGFSDADLEDFVSGPAFLAWNHFGNIQGSWGGAMPDSWVEDQFALQLKIVERMVELGIKPILPAFPGYTPRSITHVYPLANVSNGSTWEGFPTRYTNDTFLDPFDPLFEEFQVRFVSKQKDYYGNVTDLWTLDQFNENNPASGDLSYLESVSRNTWKSLKAADPDAIWVMQGWLFSSNSAFWTNDRIKAFLGGVAVDSDMLILDLFSESQPQWQRTNSFYGKPWIWCELHGYGGNYGLYGQITNVTVNAIEAVGASKTLVGFGLTPEGLEGNEIMYDLLLDQAWSKEPIDTATYFHDWVSTRYGASRVKLPSGVYAAWEILRPTVFNNTNLVANAVPKSIYELVPSTTKLLNRTGHHPTLLNYDPADVVAAWNELYGAGVKEPRLFANPAYHYDLVDFTRQVLGNAFIPLYQELIAIYKTATDQTSSKQALKKQGKKMTQLLSALDLVLGTNENFKLSTWINAARATANASDPDHKAIADFLEYQARNQVTLWGPTGQISDYASRAWSGLVSTYYLPRWQKFVDYLIATPVDQYNQKAFAAELLEWELAWVNQTSGGKELLGSHESLQNVLATVLDLPRSVFAI
ncbi:glycoside hydrolase family 89 protein [Xylariaceae sp. FL0594]|nr:glycoside hydrolase family 89 protein [Xylariaceae sp. FL0594]